MQLSKRSEQKCFEKIGGRLHNTNMCLSNFICSWPPVMASCTPPHPVEKRGSWTCDSRTKVEKHFPRVK